MVDNAQKTDLVDFEKQGFDKDEWKKQKKAERDEAFSIAKEMMVKAGSEPASARLYLDLQSRFRNLSVNNIMLIASQMPGATRLADYDTWIKSGAAIKKGEKGIITLDTSGEYKKQDGSTGVSYKTKRLFDISQTSIEKENEQMMNWDGRLLLKALVESAPCIVKIDESFTLPKGKVAYYESNSKVIYIERGNTAGDLFRAISREIALAKTGSNEELRSNCGPISEAVSYMVCKRVGMDTTGFALNRFMGGLSAKSDAELRKIFTASRNLANEISNGIEAFFKTEKNEERDR